MIEQYTTTILVQTATAAFAPLAAPYEHIPFPAITDDANPFQVRAIWTLDHTRPRWNNLAVIAAEVDHDTNQDLTWWHRVSAEFDLPLTILVNGHQYVLLTRQDSGAVTTETVDPPELRQILEAKREALFSPSRLAALRGGQLTFADLDTLSPKYNVQFRHRIQLDQALENAITNAFTAQRQTGTGSESQDAAVIEVAIAYLAARILADKGFFAPYPPSVNDPRKLLQLTVEHINGFFRRICDNHLHVLSDTILEQLAAYLGSSVTFALVNDLDVGHLYEQSVLLLNKRKKKKALDSLEIAVPNLQQHYTPVAIAERMLAALPLERLRPEERVVFDPVAGSGTLLLTATKRLATMPDIAALAHDHRREYLATHVIGNDMDPNAELITRVRYTLVQETLSETFPAPTHFSTRDYKENTAWPTSPRPRVLITNPPFAEEAGTQKAVDFLQNAMQHLQEGDQFACILPQSFLTATTHGWQDVRKLVAERSHILETWQFPEGIIGLKARQATCVVSGIIGKKKWYSVARAVISAAGRESIHKQGFPGQTWVGSVAPDQWREVVAPVPRINTPAISLKQLFSVHIGVTLKPDVPPVSHPDESVPTKRFWKHSWRKSQNRRFWINPEIVPFEKRYIRYGKEYLKSYQPNDEMVYDSPKILVSRSTNRGAKEPISAYLDVLGLCPISDIYCIVPIYPQDGFIHDATFDQKIWVSLTYNERLLWLLGILNSELAIDILMPERDARHIDKDNWLNFPLPTTIDREIITIVDDIIRREQRDAPDAEIAPLRRRLNAVVEAAYGHPVRPLSLVRTGELPDAPQWQAERKEKPMSVTGQVLDVDAEKNQVLLSLAGLVDDEPEAWVPLPPELPGWALDGTVFSADISATVETFAMLRARPWALRNVKHTPRPYLSLSDLQAKLTASIEGTA
jgi:hypothetical protein